MTHTPGFEPISVLPEQNSLLSETTLPVDQIDLPTESLDAKTAPAHQRPDGVIGEWELEDPLTWSRDQKVAHATKGFITRASGISIAGGLIVASGVVDITKGKYIKGGAKVIVGRFFDLWDGEEAMKRKTRSKAGAGIDAGIDKALVVGGATMLAKASILPKPYVAATLIQEGRIVKENAQIQKEGGEPNPTKSGKNRMFVLWAGITMRIAEKALEKTGHAKAAKVAGTVAMAAEFGTLGFGEVVVAGYKGQRKAVQAKNKKATA